MTDSGMTETLHPSPEDHPHGQPLRAARARRRWHRRAAARVGRAEADGVQGAGDVLHRRRQGPSRSSGSRRAAGWTSRATYDVTDKDGNPIGEFRKDFGKSLLRSTWHLTTPDGLVAVGQERSQGVAIARRVLDIVGELPIFLRFHFDFTSPDGQIMLTSERQRSLKDRYELTVPQARERLAARLESRHRDGCRARCASGALSVRALGSAA